MSSTGFPPQKPPYTLSASLGAALCENPSAAKQQKPTKSNFQQINYKQQQKNTNLMTNPHKQLTIEK
jgi:hypothetical protein